jgi:hypothetical protein
VTELTRKHPGGLFQLTLSLAPGDALYDCPNDSETAPPEDPVPASQDDDNSSDYSNWDYYSEEYYEGEVNWNERDDPCKPAYYRYGRNIRAARNLLASTSA